MSDRIHDDNEGSARMASAYLNRIATAVPDHDVHSAFSIFAEQMLDEPRVRAVFGRMVGRAEINHRYSFLNPSLSVDHSSRHNAHQFYTLGSFPSTAKRMKVFEESAPVLMRRAVDRLALTGGERAGITHVLVTCCTGFYAPGLDFEVASYLGLSPDVERTMIGFMGCYAAINALKLARHIVRSEPAAGVLIVNLELCTLHFQQTQALEQVLSFLVFADGAAASLVTAHKQGLALDSFKAIMVPDTNELITWKVGDLGFDMMLSGRVPQELEETLQASPLRIARDEIDLWAVHPGGRSVLDAVERGLELAGDALADSREVLSSFGNMSSATIMFVLQRVMQRAQPGQLGVCNVVRPGADGGDDALSCCLAPWFMPSTPRRCGVVSQTLTATSRFKWILWASLGLTILFVFITSEVLLAADYPMYHAYRVQVIADRGLLVPHSLSGTLALLIGPVQFSSRIRQRYVKLHRMLGRTYTIAVFVGSFTGIALAMGRPGLPGTAMQAAAWMVCTAAGVITAMNRQIVVHRQWMIRSYAVTFTFVSSRILNLWPRYWSHLGDSLAAVGVIAFTLGSLLIVEVGMNWHELTTRRESKDASPAGDC